MAVSTGAFRPAITPSPEQPKIKQQAFLICEGRCLEGVSLAEKARLVTPLIDGKPDYSHAVIFGTVVKINHSLERFEVQTITAGDETN